MPIEYDNARIILETAFAQVEADLLRGLEPSVSEEFGDSCDVVFRSRTQAFREVLLGCAIARIQDNGINIRQPYVNQGANAFNGRTLDERVINPFFQDKRIPSSRGPYLSVFRRSVEFNELTREGIRDKEAYDEFLNIIGLLESTTDNSRLFQIVHHLLFKFLELREQAAIPLTRLQRMSLEQFEMLTARLLETPSGGRFPMILVVAAFRVIKDYFQLDWDISWQGINVADTASGTGGDITIRRGGEIVLAAEITERPVDVNRVIATFNAKIAPIGIEDYLFFVRADAQTAEARQQAQRYFAQGHELNFLVIEDWIVMILATIGVNGRRMFTRTLLEILDSEDAPTALRVSWNQQIESVIAGQGNR